MMDHFGVQNGRFAPEGTFFEKNHYYYFHLPIDLNLKKKITIDPGLRGCPIFGPKTGEFPQTKIFQKIY